MTYMVVLSDFEQVVHGRLQLVASHGGNHHSIQLGCQLPHVLLICVHQTLEKKKTSVVITAECMVTVTVGKCEISSFTVQW